MSLILQEQCHQLIYWFNIFRGSVRNFLSILGPENWAYFPVYLVLRYKKELIALDIVLQTEFNVPTATRTAKQNICLFTALTVWQLD